MNLKRYSDQYLGAIDIELTTLTLRFTEDSAKQQMISLQLTVMSMIGLLRDDKVSKVEDAPKSTAR